MKILWICNLPEEVRRKFDLTDVPGAAWSWVMGALPPPDGVELHILCPVFRLKTGPQHFAYRGAQWHCFELKRFEPLFLRRRFARSVRPFVTNLKPDVIHGWGGETGCGLIATYLSSRAVVGVQGLLRMLKEGHWLRRLMEVMSYRRAARLVCESETARAWLKTGYGRDAEVVTYPLRKEFLETVTTPVSERTDGTAKFLFIGQAVARKGYIDVQRAFAIVKEKFPQARLTLVTGGKSADELVGMMQTHDVFVLPSYGDTGPTAIKEALAQGMKVVAYDNTGPKELVEKYGGWLARTGDVDDLAIKMIEALQGKNRVDVGVRMKGELGRETAWQDFMSVYDRVVLRVKIEFASAENSAIGQRVRHLRQMTESVRGGIVISAHIGVRQNLSAAVRAKLSGRKVIREINEWPLSVTWGESRLKQWIEIHILPKFFDGFICISDVLVEFCREHGRRNVPIFKLPMTVDVDEIEGVEKGCRCTAEGKPLVVYAGSMTEAKDGVETLKKAMEGVDAELLMISGKTHAEAVAIMKSADCLVLARPDSLQARAGFPTKLGEYLATGIPVVVTKTGEIARYLEDGRNAYLVEPGDVKGLAEKISWVVTHPDAAKRVGESGREVAQRSFDWHNDQEGLCKWLRQFI